MKMYSLKVYLHTYRTWFADILQALKHALVAFLKVPLVILAPFFLWAFSGLFFALHAYAPNFWQRILRPKWIRVALTRYVIDTFGNVAPPRPHAFSMFAKYPTWTGLVNRRFTGRHLGPIPSSTGTLPSIAELEHLFLRPVPTGAQVNDIRSNLLFASFAQWFTDSFLRTSHKLRYDASDNTIVALDGTKKRHQGRERENDSNHEIDLCQIYGMTREQTALLRFRPTDPGYEASKHKGKLKSQFLKNSKGETEEFPAQLLLSPPDVPTGPEDKGPRTKLPIKPEFDNLYPDERLVRSIFSSAIHNANGYQRLFACGLEHGNSTIGNSLFNTIFLRKHNAVAAKIAEKHPTFDDDEVFEKTRNVMIVLLLKIVVCEYVRHISPLDLPFTVPPNVSRNQNWYRRNRIHIEFNLLYRWHSLTPDTFDFLANSHDPAANFASFRHNNEWLIQNGVADTLACFASTYAGKMTLGNTPHALRIVKRDTLKLMRNSNLASYNAYRGRFGLPKARTFEEVTGETVMAAALSDLYGGQIDKLEFYVGLVAERHRRGGIMGDLMFNMVAHDALTHALTNPLLAEELQAHLRGYRTPGAHVFSEAGVEIIAGIETLDDFVDGIVCGLQRPVKFRISEQP